MSDYTNRLLDFISKSPSCFHAVNNISGILEQNGFTRLTESESWNISPGGRYFVTRNSSSVISFIIPKVPYNSFSIVASHSDSPSFKIKENPEIKSEAQLIKLNIEKYGGMLCAPWFDRPLSVAGRLICREHQSSSTGASPTLVLKQYLVAPDKNLLMIPSLAIHMNRKSNEEASYNVQNDMLPVYSLNPEAKLIPSLAHELGLLPESVISADLFLCDRTKPTLWGAEDEFIASPRLDDLECAWTSLEAFLSSTPTTNIQVHCVFDNEEVGSQTRQGAAGTFLSQTLERISISLGQSRPDYMGSLAKSFMVSADNAHAVHPNHADKADPVNRPHINQGPVLKFNAAQKYTTDAISAAVFKESCTRAGVPHQVFTNRSDMAGGSTLGNISGTQVSINCVDVGIAQWAMHSPYESAGARDVEYMVRALREFYNLVWTLKE